jgi:HEAT repeat protein
MQRLRSRDAAERDAAACHIGELGPNGAFAVPALIEMLDDEKSYFAGLDPVGHGLYSTPAEGAMNALIEIGAPAVDALIVELRDLRAGVRARAVYALAAIEDPRAIDALVRALDDRSAHVRVVAATWIRQEDDRLLDALIKALHDHDDSVRWEASKHMQSYIHNPRVLQPLIDTLNNNTVDVQTYALIALGKLGNSPATPAIIDVLDDSSSNDSVRSYAAQALGSATDENSFDALMRALDSSSWGARSGALQAMAERRDARAVPRLIGSLANENMTERYLAADALGAIGDARAIEPLKSRLNDQQPTVRESAQKALKSIEGRVR